MSAMKNKGYRDANSPGYPSKLRTEMRSSLRHRPDQERNWQQSELCVSRGSQCTLAEPSDMDFPISILAFEIGSKGVRFAVLLH